MLSWKFAQDPKLQHEFRASRKHQVLLAATSLKRTGTTSAWLQLLLKRTSTNPLGRNFFEAHKHQVFLAATSSEAHKHQSSWPPLNAQAPSPLAATSFEAHKHKSSLAATFWKRTSTMFCIVLNAFFRNKVRRLQTSRLLSTLLLWRSVSKDTRS